VTRAAIVTGSALLRAGLESTLGNNGIQLSGSVDDLHQATGLSADVIVVDWDQEQAQELIDFAASSPPLIVLALDPQPPWLSEALRAGVRGVLPRDASIPEIAAAIEAAAAGLVVLHPEAVESPVVRIRPAQNADPLSAREIEVLKLVAEGASNKEIAWKLGISEHTVKFHLNAILTKMRAGSRTEAVMLGLRQGLIPL
jgi:NarL family two-component system response regulator YdfI